MEDTLYGGAASLMRYLFLAIMVYIIAEVAVRSVFEGITIKRAERTAKLEVRWLEFTEPPRLRAKWARASDGTTLGASSSCEIALGESSMRDIQAAFIHKRNGVYMRFYSRRLVSVNGERPKRVQRVFDMDEVTLHDVSFILHKRRDKCAEEEQ